MSGVSANNHHESTDDLFATALNELTQGLRREADPGRRLRVWSLVVTILGDSFAPRGGAVRLGVLQTILDRIGVEAGALRTAASRLAKDGWLERDRQGRASFYRLAPRQQVELDLATRRIYAAGPPSWSGAWLVAIAPDERAAKRDARADQMLRHGFGRLGPGAYFRPESPDHPKHEGLEDMTFLRAPHTTARFAPSALASAWPQAPAAAALHHDLLTRFTPLDAALEAGARLTPLDALAARSLLIHLWRRAALRDPGLPQAVAPDDWPGEAARAFTARLYWRLATPSEAWLDICLGGPDGALPPPDPAFQRRFGGKP